jgi:hypothetical protein
VIRTIDPACDVDGRRAGHTAGLRRADERALVVERNEMTIIVAIRQVHIRWRPGADQHMAIGLEQGKAVVAGKVRQPLAQKVAHSFGAKGRRQFVRRRDAEIGDPRLNVLESAIDQLDIALGLLAEHDAKIADRDEALFEGLPMQVPDRCAATEQDDDDECDADRPQVQARTQAALPGRRDVGPGLHLLALHPRAKSGGRCSMRRGWLISA